MWLINDTTIAVEVQAIFQNLRFHDLVLHC